MKIFQYKMNLHPQKRGFHLITDEIVYFMKDITKINTGLANIFIKHTSASLAISENADPTVRIDLENHFDRAIPDDIKLYKHFEEGLDDMTSHIKNVIIGASLNIPISDGKLNLGIWQGIYLCEHRDRAKSRELIITLTGI